MSWTNYAARTEDKCTMTPHGGATLWPLQDLNIIAQIPHMVEPPYGHQDTHTHPTLDSHPTMYRL